MSEAEQIARRHGLPEGFGERLRGSTDEELDADAKGMADALGVEPEPEHVALARRAIEAAENNPNVGELALLAQARLKNRGLAELLGGAEGED